MNDQIGPRDLSKLRGPLSTTFAFVLDRGAGDGLRLGRVAEPQHGDVQGVILKGKCLWTLSMF